jgi:hypothetical protein
MDQRERGTNAQILHQHIQALTPAGTRIHALQHGRHVARLDALQHLDDGLQRGVARRLVAGALVHGRLEAAPQRALGVAPAQQLPHLAGQAAHVGLADLGLRRVQRGGVEVDRRVLLQRVDVDGAPGVAERRLRVLADDGHGGRSVGVGVGFGGWGVGVRCTVRCTLTRLSVVGIDGCGSQVWWLSFLEAALLLRAPRCCSPVGGLVARSGRKSAMAWDLLDVAGKQLSPALELTCGAGRTPPRRRARAGACCKSDPGRNRG